MKRILPLIFALFSLVANLYSQQYPVTIVPRVSAPAPVNFYNYADETSLNSPITVQIFLNDITVSNRQIRLRTYFEGGNIQFRSKDFVLGAENLYLEGGVPLTLRNQELAPYYKYENIEGINTATYAQTIPEGSYNFCFEVYDYLSGAKLSSKKCATVFIFKNEPPILNLPFNKANIEPQDFENIVFQWTPRHINVSNVEYEFALVEVWDNHIDPRTAFLSQAPIYETTTRTTTLVYGPDKPLLLPGKRYAWRVRAKALQGLEEIGLFKNQGYSEVFWFSRTAPCQIPEDVNAEAKGTSKINVFWNQDPTIHSEFIIAYREADKQDAHWFTKRTNSGWATIWDLKPGTTYEYKVKGKCRFQYSGYSKIQKVRTDFTQNDNANYNCGIVPDAIAISNREPHPGLNVGNEITAGDFRVVLTEIDSQMEGVISGKGYVVVPYLNFAKFGVTYNGILVNSSNQLAEGEIVTFYDPNFGEGASMTVDINIGSDGIVNDVSETDNSTDLPDDSSSENETNDQDSSGTDDTNSDEDTEDEDTPPDTPGDGEETPDETPDSNEDPGIDENTPEGDTDVETSENEEVFLRYKEKNYKHKDEITIPFKNDLPNQYFELVNTKEGSRVEWSFHKDFEAISATKALGKGNSKNINVKKDINVSIVLQVEYWKKASDFPKENSKKIRVMLKVPRKKFELLELYASDANNKKRVAKSGEVLYLVKATGITNPNDRTRIVDYSITTFPKLKIQEIKSNDIVWNYRKNGVKQHEFGKVNLRIPVRESKVDFETEVEGGYLNKNKKKNNIKWIEEGRERIDVANKLGPLLKAFDKINYVTKPLKKYGFPCELTILENIDRLIGRNEFKVSFEKYNTEDEVSRYYNEIKKFKFEAKGAELFKLKCGKDVTVPIPFTSKKVTIVGANFEIGVGLKGKIEIKRSKQIETDNVNYKGSKVSGGGYVKPKFVLTVAGVNGKIDVETGISFEYPYKNSKSTVGVIFYTSDMYGYVDISKDASVFVTNDFRYDLFKVNTKSSIEIYEFNLADLIK
ncbi:hypothetical protein DS884_04080 [Tenacibaculum sp. E3R01]|uniref:fibronectin type III domain-containing protein n=1 Tax=Tenacibaculum sp. E3R01 TaxID=2267227 RepID=UPI000DEA7DB3|nr:fibronectin type III domain-containing protein [Tenacibaculum sp. E3R01]RBW60764.1 hypothetical protein DS884_04080 [Tenacibaculum sp. E3R01]